jgi:hypothetical protein
MNVLELARMLHQIGGDSSGAERAVHRLIISPERT